MPRRRVAVPRRRVKVLKWSGLLAAFSSGWLALYAAPACAVDLMEVWRAAQFHDQDYAVARAEQAMAAAKLSQAAALWRPTANLVGAAGVASGETSVRGAQFSAPAFGSSESVAFNTSVNNGLSGRWLLSGRLPLISRERDAQGRQLVLSADIADLDWHEAQQSLMLASVQRYFDVVLASEALRVLRRQQDAINQALVESRDRFRIGDVPVTDTYEAAARAEAIGAQRLALETDLQIKQADFEAATGLVATKLTWRTPGRSPVLPELQALDYWLKESAARNWSLRKRTAAVELARQEAAKTDSVFAPSVDLVAQIGGERLSGNGDYGSASNSSSNRIVGVQVTLPIYTGGMQGARLLEALSGIEKAQAQADRTRQQVAQRTRVAWLGLTVGAGRIAALAQALESSRLRLDATRLGRQVGDRTTLDLLNAENDAANAELTLLQARIELLINRLRLADVAGQLDETWLQQANASLELSPSR